MVEGKNIIEGLPLERSIYSSLGELMLMVLKMHNEKILQIDAETAEQLSANTLLNRAIHLAKWLKKKNIGVGDSISTISENRLEYCIVPVAAFFVGAIFAPLNPLYTPGELQHVMSLSKPKIVFCSFKTIDRMISCQNQFPYIKNIVLFGNQSTYNKDILSFEDIIKGARVRPVDEEFEATPVDPDETVATILCSSGTTGLPKGVMTTHTNMTMYIEVISRVLEEFLTEQNSLEGDVITGLSPFFHNMGFMIMFISIMTGNTVIVFSKFNPKHFLESIVKYKIATIIVPPPIIMFLARHPLVKEYDTSSIKNLKCGAAPLGKDFEKEVIKKDIADPAEEYVPQLQETQEAEGYATQDPFGGPESPAVIPGTPGQDPDYNPDVIIIDPEQVAKDAEEAEAIAQVAAFEAAEEAAFMEASIARIEAVEALNALLFKIDNVSQNYGMTETTLGVLMTRKDHIRLGSVGRIVPAMKCKVADEDGNALGPNQEGELCFKGPLIMKGYVNDPKATNDIIDKDKWLHTGDIGYYDEDGYFYIVDRIKELIKYNAFQVAPAELEALLLTHPAVIDVAVVGVDDPAVGELPLAYVVTKSNYLGLEEELKQFVKDRVSPQKWLRGGVRFLDSIPRNPSGKILRRVLRKQANKELQAKL